MFKFVIKHMTMKNLVRLLAVQVAVFGRVNANSQQSTADTSSTAVGFTGNASNSAAIYEGLGIVPAAGEITFPAGALLPAISNSVAEAMRNVLFCFQQNNNFVECDQAQHAIENSPFNIAINDGVIQLSAEGDVGLTLTPVIDTQRQTSFSTTAPSNSPIALAMQFVRDRYAQTQNFATGNQAETNIANSPLRLQVTQGVISISNLERVLLTLTPTVDTQQNINFVTSEPDTELAFVASAHSAVSEQQRDMPSLR